MYAKSNKKGAAEILCLLIGALDCRAPSYVHRIPLLLSSRHSLTQVFVNNFPSFSSIIISSLSWIDFINSPSTYFARLIPHRNWHILSWKPLKQLRYVTRHTNASICLAGRGEFAFSFIKAASRTPNHAFFLEGLKPVIIVTVSKSSHHEMFSILLYQLWGRFVDSYMMIY